MLKLLSYEDYVEDLKANKGKNVLQAITPIGGITIEVFGKVIRAVDHDGKEVAVSTDLNEEGLAWVKKSCRGWHGWKRLNWKVITKPNNNIKTCQL